MENAENPENPENPENHDDRLIPFLRNLANSIESHDLLPRQLQSIGEFFMTYQFQEQAIRDGDTSSMARSLEFSHDELLKFIITGWYIYCCILQNRSVSSSSDDVD